MFIRARKSLINKVPNYGKQKKYRGKTIAYGDLMKDQTSTVKKETENRTEPSYPPIRDLSFHGIRRKDQQALGDKIKALETVEEKLFKINMPRYYGWQSLILNEHEIPYNSLTHAQHITRTHIMKEPGLPACYNGSISNEQLDDIIQEIRGNVEDTVVFEYSKNSRRCKVQTSGENGPSNRNSKEFETGFSNRLIDRINRAMLAHLSPRFPHLLHAEVDFMPRLEASWFLGGVEPSTRQKFQRMKDRYLRNHVDEPITIPIQYNGQPAMHLRHRHPLREIVPLSECENLDVPTFDYSAKVLGYRTQLQHLTNIPGFWPGNENEFGFLSYHNCGYLSDRPKEFNDTPAALAVQGVLASYSWLLSQACYQGFSAFNDITYPLTTQTVITNGQWWSFFVYQLNTTAMRYYEVNDNPKRNICWLSGPMKLFDTIENDKMHGLNEDVLKTLVKFYANAPEERRDVNLKPYLGESVKVIADIEHDEKRNWLEKHYKHLVSNRPRHRAVPEIYHWQRFYMIRYQTRPMDKRREPFEFGIDVLKRQLDDHTPPYIPKCMRENPKKKRVGRWENMYYP